MKTTFVSSVAISSVTRHSILRTQADLGSAQKEVTSGRLADVGLTLGGRTGQTVSLRQEHSRLETIIASNARATSRLEMTQLTLDHLRNTADNFLGNLIRGGDSKAEARTVQNEGVEGLKGLIEGLNSTSDGQHAFGGINSGVRPITEYFASPAASNKQAVDNAFAAAFGMTQSDPAVGTISAADMQAFLDGDFRALFEEPQWSADWSAASSEDVTTRISVSQSVQTSVNANEEGVRKLAMAYTMVADLGTQGLSSEAYSVVTAAAAQLASEGLSGIESLQSQAGGAQHRIAQMNERMSLQMDLLARDIRGLENVDPFEAATRVTDLMTQLETGYALTARIQRLSILNYL